MSTIDLPDVETLVARLAADLRRYLDGRGIDDPRLLGIQTGGVWLAHRLHAALGASAPVGTLDISFHRDDLGSAGLNPAVRPSHLPWDIEGRHLVLVDDVLWTGRTVRAALNEIFDWGRPASVALAVLVVRDGRELPVEPSALGARIDLPPRRMVKLRGPEPLRLEVVDAA